MLANTKYTYRHNQIATYIHWWILKDLGSNVKDTWQEHTPHVGLSDYLRSARIPSTLRKIIR